MLFEGVSVVDGTGAAAYVADVAVEGSRVVSIRRSEAAAHLTIAPGFVDMHAHADLSVLSDSAQLAKLSQGVTTQVLGQDGIGYAPVDDEALALVRRQIAGWNGDLPDSAFTWRDTAGYLGALEAVALGTNVAYLVPQGNLRLLTVGSADRPATASEIDRMRGILADGLSAGAVGMSSGLTYTPGMYASTAELEALCTVVAEHGGYWAPHTRGYGGGALDAFAECIGIGLRTGCAVHQRAGQGTATEAALDLMLADRLATGILMHVGDEENVRAIMRHPRHSGGSDGILVGGRPHPRAWGTFARYLGHYTRDLGVLTLEECVRHMAATPAARLGLTDRGVLREGSVADLVVFDAATVADRATFDEPRLPAAGIVHVLVGGEFAVRDGVRTEVAAGVVLRR